jgi:hypothetical protein
VTFAAEEAGQLLSRDARGRVLVSRERREALLVEYDRSGMSGVKFAQYIGIKYSTLTYWLQSRRLIEGGRVVAQSGNENRSGREQWRMD